MTAPYRITPVSGTERELWVRDAEGEGVAHVYGETPEQARERAEAVVEGLLGVCCYEPCCFFGKPAPHVHQSAPDVSCDCEQGEELP